MSESIQRLKSRLQIKFEPIHSNRRSLKKLQQCELKQRIKKQQKMLQKSRSISISQTKLPRINSFIGKYKDKIEYIQDSKQFVNVSELRQKNKSLKQIPKVRIQSKQSINQTIAYLMKNEILNVPRIVALLQKNQSQQFFYLKMTGLYQYQACKDKQFCYPLVTVSKNGLVQNGQLIPLEILCRELELFTKLSKIGFFKYFCLIKFMGKWKQGSKKVRYAENRRILSRLLNLTDKKHYLWKIQIFHMFDYHDEGGDLQSRWVLKMTQFFEQTKIKCSKRLVDICYKMLQQFDLPISDSVQIMNRALANLSVLSISFEKKMKIQKQCQKFYKLGRQLQMSAMEKTAKFILSHLENLINNIKIANKNYITNVLESLQYMNLHSEVYSYNKINVLLKQNTSYNINYILYIGEDKTLKIKPTIIQIYHNCLEEIKLFVKNIEKIGFYMLRTTDFKFIMKNIFKAGENQITDNQVYSFKNFVYEIDAFQTLSAELQTSFLECQTSFDRRIQLLQPFLQLYLSYSQDRRQKYQFNNRDLQLKYQQIQQSIKYSDKFNDTQPIVFGILSLVQFRKQIVVQIEKHRQQFLSLIPIKLNERKLQLYKILQKHRDILNSRVDNAKSFIKTYMQIQHFQQNYTSYLGLMQQNQRIQHFYERVSKRKAQLQKNEKKIFNQIKYMVKTYMEQKNMYFNKYRLILDQDKNHFIKNFNSINFSNQHLYQIQQDTQGSYKQVVDMLGKIINAKNYLEELNTLQSYFNLKPTVKDSIQYRLKQYQNLQQLWKITYNIDKDTKTLQDIAIKDIKPQTYLKTAQGWKIKMQKTSKDIDMQSICKKNLSKIQKIINNMQTIQYINQQHLREKDLDQINILIQKFNNISQRTCLCREISYLQFNSFSVCSIKLEIQEIVFKARKEIQIAQNLNEFNQWWKNVKLQYEVIEQFPNVVVFGDNEQVKHQVDQYITMLTNMISNKYGTFVRSSCHKYLKNMSNLVELLHLTKLHQQKLLNLFPILTSKFAENQLAIQCKKFDMVLNKTIKNIKFLAKPTQNLNDNTRKMLNNHIKSFDQISSVLEKFLEKKRLKFQRFYFLQDYELLQVLVGTGDQNHVFRMFEGIKGWLVSPEGLKIGVIGAGDERFQLKGWSYKNTQPQMVFKSLQDAMKNNLNTIVRSVLYHYEVQMKDLKQLYEGVPWMCVYAVQLILYTKQVQLNCFHNGIPLSAQQSLIKQALHHATVNPTLYSNYITLLIHLLHFTEQMKLHNVQSIFDFQWHSFLRSYFQKDGVLMRALSNQIKWGGEYQGIWSLMINTSDIRRAHICVLSNMQFANGVLLQGPSGTGKTESLKQLARCTAKYCVIFNCSQNVSFKSMSKLLLGLCYTGSWLCLDEINRLRVETMSVIAKQIQNIKNALLIKKQTANILGKDIKLKQGIVICSTMNPIYLNRAKLTENIKAYFRTVTVTMPEYQTIIQILLFGLKFIKNRELASKISNVFSNLSIQLSNNVQYDFGLRTMKFMIYKIQKLKKQSNNQLQIVAKAIYEIFELKLLSSDKIIFEKIIQDVFHYRQQNNKKTILQLVNSMRQSNQTGIIIFGKTSLKSSLIKQYYKSYQNHNVEIFNPNSTQIKYFIGELNHGKWQEGIVQKLAKQSLLYLQKIHILVLDSVLKSQIIQNFNTLLDQSKLLTLPNGSRLKIQSNFKIIMETPHLNFISPSTITRCHIIYIRDQDVQTNSLIQFQLPSKITNSNSWNRIKKIYSKLTHNQIRQVGQLSQIIMSKKIQNKSNQLQDNEVLGIQRAVVFATRLLGISKKIAQYMNKDNTFSIKKSPFNYILSYQKNIQGEYIQISRTYQPIYQYQRLTLKTSQEVFMNWLTTKSINKQNKPILWKGVMLSGKSIAIRQILKFNKCIKININNNICSNQFIQMLLPHVVNKKNQENKENGQVVVYLENLYLANSELLQLIRFIIQYNKLFSTKTRQIIQMIPVSFVGESRQLQNPQFYRTFRHFSQLILPLADVVEFKNIYCQFVKYYLDETNVAVTLKNSINSQSDRFCGFLAAYEKKKMQNEKIRKGPYEGKRILQQIKYLNIKNCNQVNDFIRILLEALKAEDQLGQKSNIQILNQCYLQFYKSKFMKQYQMYLKNTNFIIKFNQNNNSVKNEIQSSSTIIENQLQKMQNKYYISKYVQNQIQHILRGLQNQSSHYCIISNQGMGKKTLYRIACKIGGYELQQINQSINILDIKKLIFDKMKKGFQNKKKYFILVNLQFQSNKTLLTIAQQIKTNSITQLFDSQITDYMYANISEYAQGYNKLGKSYEEVCEDYVQFSLKYLSFLIVSTNVNQKIGIHCKYPSIAKYTYFRYLREYPVEALVQCFTKIIQNRFKIDISGLKSAISIDEIPKLLIKIYKILKELAQKNKKNNLTYYKFNQFNMFKIVTLFCQYYQHIFKNINQQHDTLHQSVQKVIQICKQQTKLKQQIAILQPQITNKKNDLLKLIPTLQQKKKRITRMSYIIEQNKKQIQIKNQQIQSNTKTIQNQINQQTLLVHQANDSIQTIKRSEVIQIRNNINSYPFIKFIIQNLLTMLGQIQTPQNIKKLLSDLNLISRIKNSLPTLQNTLKVKKKMNQCNQWSYQNMSKISNSSKSIYKWLINQIKVKDIQIEIQKKNKQLQKLKSNKLQYQQSIQTTIISFQILNKQFNLIQQQYTQIKNKLHQLQSSLSRNIFQYQNSIKITNILKHYIVKWNQKINCLKQTKNHLIPYCINLCLEIKVYANLNAQQQISTRQQVINILHESNLSLPQQINIAKDLISSKDQKNILQKLSHQDKADNKKVILAKQFYNRPIIIDPDNQASNWLQKLFPNNQIKYIKNNYQSSNKIVQNCMKYGQILIIILDQQIDNFSLDIIKCLDKCTQSNHYLIEYNKNIFHLHQQFALLFYYQFNNPNISLKNSLTHQIINFELTKSNLQNNLLHIVLKNEKQQLFNKKIIIQKKIHDIQQNTYKINQQIIYILLNNKKNIIQDQITVALLVQNIKKCQLVNTHKNQIKLQLNQTYQFMNSFKSICNQVADIFITLKQLSKINSNLVWNLNILISYFIQSSQKSLQAPQPDQQSTPQQFLNADLIGTYQFDEIGPIQSRPNTAISNLSINISRTISQQYQDNQFDNIDGQLKIKKQGRYENNGQEQGELVNSGGFQIKFEKSGCKEDNVKNISTLFNIQNKSYKQDLFGFINDERYQFILTNIYNLIKKGLTNRERYIWSLIIALKSQKKQDLQYLNVLNFPKTKSHDIKLLSDQNLLPDGIKKYISRFNKKQLDQQLIKIFSNDHSIQNSIQKLKHQLTLIQILILCKLVYPQKILNVINYIINKKKLTQIISYQQLQISQWIHPSDNIHPVLLLMGQDPINMISQYLQKKKYKNATLITMGQQQGKGIDLYIQKQCQKQGIFIIHNLNIAQNFWSSLGRLIQVFCVKSPHPNFRLILVSNIQANLPEEIVSMCHKFIVQQPSGLKNKIKGLYRKSESYINHTIVPLHKLTYSLCLMHSLINQMQQFGRYCWNIPTLFTIDDFITSLLAIKTCRIQRQQYKNFYCNIQIDEIENQIKQNQINFNKLRYIIGQTCYIAKITDNIDRKKMRIIVYNHFNQDILKSNYMFWQQSQLSQHFLQVFKRIDQIDQTNPKTYGIYDGANLNKETGNAILAQISAIFLRNNLPPQQQTMPQFKQIAPINHKLGFINSQIQNYNTNRKYQLYSQLLKQIRQNTNVFNLRAFSNPRQFFSSVIIEAAIKNNTPYDNIMLIWSVIYRQGYYGISNLTLQGGCLKNGVLVMGSKHKELTLYFSAIIKRKSQEINKGKISIPLYLNEERCEVIGSFGENVNLLTQISIDSKQSGEFWTLRSTAFVVS